MPDASVEERTDGRFRRSTHAESPLLKFYDFFAGAGMATLGLASRWDCIWANDIDERKATVYGDRFGRGHFVRDDIANVSAASLPKPAHLAWASFPCQDLSLAGWRRGLSAERSGAFWPFWRIMHDLLEVGQRPPIVVIENVVGLLYGDSFAGLCEALAALNMQFGALVMDARKFVPQSRPRVFVVAVDSGWDVSAFEDSKPVKAWTPKSLTTAKEALPDSLKAVWRWWSLAAPRNKVKPLGKIIEENPTSVEWHTPDETRKLLGMMSEKNRGKVDHAIRAGGEHIGFLYKRIRKKVQRAEVRFDGISGCLRTPKGGSSRQTVIIVKNGHVRSRLLSPREAARLMGVPDDFKLPEAYNDAYRAMGDGVAVPVVSWLSENLLFPLVEECIATEAATDRGKPANLNHLLHYRRSSERRADEWLMSLRLSNAQ
jgi:DNA (cytosine-5)-methyltransferase 1